MLLNSRSLALVIRENLHYFTQNHCFRHQRNGNSVIYLPLGVSLMLFLDILKAIKGFLEITVTVQLEFIFNN